MLHKVLGEILTAIRITICLAAVLGLAYGIERFYPRSADIFLIGTLAAFIVLFLLLALMCVLTTPRG